MKNQNEVAQVNPWKILGWLLDIVAVVGLSLATWNLTTVVRLSERVTAIEAGNFTVKDGASLWQEIAKIREQLSRVPTEAPPAWFVKRVDTFEADMKTRLDRIEQNQARLDANQNAMKQLIKDK